MTHDHDGHREHPPALPSTDLSYLDPENLRIGSIGVFAGDWAWTGTSSRIPVGFVGVLVDWWNGWAVWRCTREVAEAVATDQERLRAEERARLAETGLTGDELDEQVDENLAPVYFDGDDLVLEETAQHGEPSVQRHGPGRDGRYCPMGFNWTWQAVRPDWCERIVGVLPAFGQHREYVLARHQPLRMPHDRLAIIAVDDTTTGPGTTSTAVLAVNDQPVGVVRQRPGQPAQFHSEGPAFSQQDLDDFVAACRWRGHTVDTSTVLHALVAEYKATAHIAAAARNGMAAVIMRDGDDHIVGTDIFLEPRPIAPGDRQTLAELFTAREQASHPQQTQFVWQIWDGRRWQMLGILDVPRDDTSTLHELPGRHQPATTGPENQVAASTAPETPVADDGGPEAGRAEQNGRER